MLDWTGGPVTLKALRAGGATLGKVSKVELVGSDVALTFVQGDQGLVVTPSGSAQPKMTSPTLAVSRSCRRFNSRKSPAANSTGFTSFNDPSGLPRDRGVRTAS